MSLCAVVLQFPFSFPSVELKGPNQPQTNDPVKPTKRAPSRQCVTSVLEWKNSSVLIEYNSNKPELEPPWHPDTSAWAHECSCGMCECKQIHTGTHQHLVQSLLWRVERIITANTGDWIRNKMFNMDIWMVIGGVGGVQMLETGVLLEEHSSCCICS